MSTRGGFAISNGQYRPDRRRNDHGDIAAPLGPTAVPTFDAVFVDEYPKMVALAAAVSGRRAFAEDLAQEAMVRLHSNWSRIQGYESPGAWLRRVTINLALSRRRRLADEAKARLRLRSAPTHRLSVSATSEHQPVWEAVATLPGKQLAALALRYLEDRSVDEIADVLEVAPSTVRVDLHRAAQTLRERLPDFDPRPLVPTDHDDEEARP